MNQLNNLKKCLIIIIDTKDIHSIFCYNLQNYTANPSLILQKTLITTIHNTLLQKIVIYSQKKRNNQYAQIKNANNKQLIVNIKIKILQNISISKHIPIKTNTQSSFNQNQIIIYTHNPIKIYQTQNVHKNHILIKIAIIFWAIIKSAKKLKKSRIKYNLTLIFYSVQIKIYNDKIDKHFIPPFIKHIYYNWYYQHNDIKQHIINNNYKILLPMKKNSYYKTYNYTTIVININFYAVEQILILSDYNYLTITPKLLHKLSSNIQPIQYNLYSNKKIYNRKSTSLSKLNLLLEHNQRQIDTKKLNKIIQIYPKNQENLNNLLIQKSSLQ